MLRSIIATVSLALALAVVPTSALAAPPPAGASAETSAMEAFKTSHEAVLSLVKKKAPDQKIEKQVDSFLDYKWLAEASLGGSKRYAKRCEPRCAEFEALLTKLIRENYLHRIHQADKGSIQYVGEEVRKNGTKAKVDTLVEFTKNGRKQQLKIRT